MSSGCSKSFPAAQPALGYGLTETNAVGCGNFWGNYAAKPASTGRAAARPSSSSPSSATAIAHLPPGERGEIAIRSAANIKCYWRNPGSDRGGLHRRRLFPHRRHRLPRRGRLSVHRRPQEGHHHPRRREYLGRPRSRPPATPARTSPRRRCSARPTSGSAKFRSRSSIRAKAAASTRPDLRAFLEARLAAFKIPARMIFSAEPLPRLGTGKIDRVALKAAVRRIEACAADGRPPHPADRRRRRRRAGRRLPRLAAGEGSALRPGPAKRCSAISSRSRPTGGSPSPCRRSRPGRASGPAWRRSPPTSLARRGRISRSSRRRTGRFMPIG